MLWKKYSSKTSKKESLATIEKYTKFWMAIPGIKGCY
jgi:hypothetical protein